MKMKWNVALLAVFFVFAAGSSRAVYAAPPTEACSLLTPAQVSAVLGISAGTGRRLIAKICGWPSDGASKKKVMLTILEADHWAYTIMPIGHGVVKTHVKGLGDDAIYGSTPGLPAVLDVKKGNAAFQVVVTGFSPDENQAKEKTLALEVLGKL